MSGRAADIDFARIVKPGDHIAWPQGTGEPRALTSRLMEQVAELDDVTIMPGMVTAPTLDRAGDSGASFLCLNGAANTRKAVAASRGRVVPAHVSAIPGLIASRRLRVDVALVRVRPTPWRGLFSLGVMVDYVHELIEAARVVVAEVDPAMPLTGGDTLIRADAVTHLVDADGSPNEIADPEPTAVDLAVARRVAELIPDTATVQFGVGGLPVAVARCLAGHKDLGLHSGVVSDAAVDLLEQGVITNRHKGVDAGVSVTGGLFGTRRLFAFADRNPAICLRRATYTHVPRTMAQLNRFHTINSAIAIDLTGQVNAEEANGRYVGAVGGQVDFVRGARLSAGGRSIIALSSTTADGRHSKIVADLGGAPVTTARSDVDLVVTEHGVADLWGLDLAARAHALAAIAHPAFRDALAAQAGAA